MHPGMIAWWHARRAGACGDSASCVGAHEGPPHRHGWRGHGHGHDHGPGHGHGPEERGGWGHRHAGPRDGDDGGDFGAGAFGVRRPLRFLAYKLELKEEQVAALAAVLDDLKTERAQGAVDQRRSTAVFADAIGGAAFDEKAVGDAASARVASATRLRDAVVKALGRIHALLDPEQRAKLAYLLRTGALSI